MNYNERIFNPPWQLQGSGHILFLKGREAYKERQNLWKEEKEMRRFLPLGVCMLVNYTDTPVGPYQEILFSPGLYRFKNGHKSFYRFSISKIYVSTMASVENGLENWAIPKEIANFSIVKKQETTSYFIQNESGEMQCSLKSKGPFFPVSTAVLPLLLGQKKEKDLFLTRADAHGRGKFARCQELQQRGSIFPLRTNTDLLFALEVQDFQMIFRKPECIKNFFHGNSE